MKAVRSEYSLDIQLTIRRVDFDEHDREIYGYGSDRFQLSDTKALVAQNITDVLAIMAKVHGALEGLAVS